MRKTVVALLLVSFLSVPAIAQTSQYLKKGTWEFGLWGGGGNGLSNANRWRFANAGFRVGKVLSNERGTGFFRGNFEFTADIIPLWLVRQDRTIELTPEQAGLPPLINGQKPYILLNTGRRETVYGGGFAPVILKWNFTRGRKIAPYVAAEGGAIFTTRDIPSPNTSFVNFTPGAAFGIQYFTTEKQALIFSTHITHISNASLGDNNPGLNAVLLFRVGYSWFK